MLSLRKLFTSVSKVYMEIISIYRLEER